MEVFLTSDLNTLLLLFGKPVRLLKEIQLAKLLGFISV